MLRNLSRVFGKTIEWKGDVFHTFPTLASISSASQAELLQCGLGYRSVYIQNTVKSILNQDVDMKIIEKANYTESKLELMKLCGVGEKIADCILLFSLDKLDAFPIDTWIVKLLQEYLNNILVASPDVKINSKLSPNQYKVISKKIRDHYGKYSGYAQQFLYYSIRERNGRKW
jgi:N-glycosylase/DNA lyase